MMNRLEQQVIEALQAYLTRENEAVSATLKAAKMLTSLRKLSNEIDSFDMGRP